MARSKHEKAGSLSEADVFKVWELAALGFAQTAIAKRFGVGQTTISRILAREGEMVELREETPSAIVVDEAESDALEAEQEAIDLRASEAPPAPSRAYRQPVKVEAGVSVKRRRTTT